MPRYEVWNKADQKRAERAIDDLIELAGDEGWSPAEFHENAPTFTVRCVEQKMPRVFFNQWGEYKETMRLRSGVVTNGFDMQVAWQTYVEQEAFYWLFEHEDEE